VRRADRCVATALVAYRDRWLDRPDPLAAARAFADECRRRHGERFLGVITSDGNRSCDVCKRGHVARGGVCWETRAAAEARCRTKYGARFSSVSLKANGKYSCRVCKEGRMPIGGGKCRFTREGKEASCRSKYGARFLNVVRRDDRWVCRFCKEGRLPTPNGKCRFTRDGKEASCRAKYGSRFSRLARQGDKWVCRFCKEGTYPVAGGKCRATLATKTADCRDKYGARFLKVVKNRSGSYVCRYCEPGTLPRNGRCAKVAPTSIGTPPCPTQACMAGGWRASDPSCRAYSGGQGACPSGYPYKNRFGCCRTRPW
jgi:hypothetical protein